MLDRESQTFDLQDIQVAERAIKVDSGATVDEPLQR